MLQASFPSQTQSAEVFVEVEKSASELNILPLLSAPAVVWCQCSVDMSAAYLQIGPYF
jgi:hypothetical protein